MIHVQLIGPPTVTGEGARCATLSAPRSVTLLALLLLEAKPEVSRAHLGAKPEVSRAHLGATLWPSHGEVERKNNLRVALHRQRAAWPQSSEALVIDRHVGCVTTLGQIRALLGGALLEGHNTRWIQAHRRHLQQRLHDWLIRAVPPLTASLTPELSDLRAALHMPPKTRRAGGTRGGPTRRRNEAETIALVTSPVVPHRPCEPG